ncbi:hypothetical protein Tco_1305874 [Tanacetum coccineum]
MGQQWHQSQRNDQRNDKGSWIKRKLNKHTFEEIARHQQDWNSGIATRKPKQGRIQGKKIDECKMLQVQKRDTLSIIVRKPNKYADGLGTFEDQGEGMKPNKYTEGIGTFKDQAKGFADHFSTTVAGMDVVAEPNKHVSNNKAFKEIKKEDNDFVII